MESATATSQAHSPLELALLPSGSLTLASSSEDAALIVAAFERGAGHGLLHLGTAELESHLPAELAYFRELARVFLTRVCTLGDLEERRADLAVPPPADALEALALSAPPFRGAEYVSREVLERLWDALAAALVAELASFKGTVQDFLRERSPLWNLVGRVCFHLAENKKDARAPFAFLATYTARLTAGGKAQHVPLGRAVAESATAKDKAALLALLVPVQRAAEKSPLVRALVDSGEVYHPLAWTPAEAHRFLKEIPTLEACGLTARVPDWWHARRPTRPEVRVTVGMKPPSMLGADSLLDFTVDVTLGGEKLTRAEWEAILAATDGLALVRGRWVEVDPEKLEQVLAHWKTAESAARHGVSFVEGMRLLSGLTSRDGEVTALESVERDWSAVVAGAGLKEILDELRAPGADRDTDPGAALEATLRPYQRTGVAWLAKLERLGLGGCLADDMGLGKTIQVLGLLLLRKRRAAKSKAGPALLVVPASLVGNWKAEAARFAPSLRVLVAHPSEMTREDLDALSEEAIAAADLVVTTYGSLHRMPTLGKTRWDLVVLDEAQAIKNPGAKQTRAAKALDCRTRLALTGTPVENRLSDLWSLFDFLNPGLLGSGKAFTKLTKRLEESASPDRYGSLRALVRPYILRRLKTDRSVIADLPEKTEVRAFCSLSKKQAALYQQSVDGLKKALEDREGIERRGAILALLLRLKQICNHPSQWLGDKDYAPDESGKLLRLRELCEPIAARQEKVLVFTQFREMTAPLERFLADVFGQPGLVLHGETAVKNRRGLVEEFQREGGPPFFVLSLKAGGTGLNLTAASHVVHFDRWWNPAVEDQATDRAFRIGQKKNVLVHKFVCRGTVEEKVDSLIESKRGLARSVVEGGGELLLTEMGDDELLELVSLDVHRALAE